MRTERMEGEEKEMVTAAKGGFRAATELLSGLAAAARPLYELLTKSLQRYRSSRVLPLVEKLGLLYPHIHTHTRMYLLVLQNTPFYYSKI